MFFFQSSGTKAVGSMEINRWLRCSLFSFIFFGGGAGISTDFDSFSTVNYCL
jgi:hypothetical protein